MPLKIVPAVLTDIDQSYSLPGTPTENGELVTAERPPPEPTEKADASTQVVAPVEIKNRIVSRRRSGGGGCTLALQLRFSSRWRRRCGRSSHAAPRGRRCCRGGPRRGTCRGRVAVCVPVGVAVGVGPAAATP